LRTWNVTVISILILVSIIYGVWFNFLDSAAYCYLNNEQEVCKPIGEALGHNNLYQTWNIIGHLIPSLFLFLYFRKIELLFVSLLISTSIMDSPIWGIMRLVLYENVGLWHCADGKCEPTHGCDVNYEQTSIVYEWMIFYYNPFGFYPVWEDYWPIECSPTSALIFWSLVLRVSIAIVIIGWQERVEKKGKRFSIIKELIAIIKQNKNS
jgi:hypothetical protein